MLKNILGGVVGGIVVVVIAIFAGFGSSDELGGNKWWAIAPDFRAGFEQNNTVRLDKSGNATFVDVTATDDFTLTDDATISGDLAVTGDVTLTGTTAGTGNCSFGGASSSSVASCTIGESTGTSTIIFGNGSGTVADESVCFSWVEGGAGQTKTRVWIVPTGTTPFIERFTAKPAACP